jgi:hypothetical protein
MWTIIFTIYCICFAKGVTISTVQKTSILPYSFPDGLIDPQHHYVSCKKINLHKNNCNSCLYVDGYQIIGSEILYLAKRSLHSGNKYKIIRMNLETLSQSNENKSFIFYLNFLSNNLISYCLLFLIVKFYYF